jgi:hypothetical protein
MTNISNETLDYSESTIIERALDSRVFQRMLESDYSLVRAVAIGTVVVHAFSKAIGHPEYLDQL